MNHLHFPPELKKLRNAFNWVVVVVGLVALVILWGKGH
jgi:hypothetical protein